MELGYESRPLVEYWMPRMPCSENKGRGGGGRIRGKSSFSEEATATVCVCLLPGPDCLLRTGCKPMLPGRVDNESRPEAVFLFVLRCRTDRAVPHNCVCLGILDY